MKLHLKLLIINYSLLIGVYGQSTAIGQWRDHLPYSNTIAVAEAGSRIYCATKYCIFYYDKSDNSVARINKVNGLSDFGVNTIKFSSKYKTLIIAYSNTNIDIIDKEGQIINISDIKRKQILGNKTINRISIIGDNAYLSCSFGVVVFDIAKREVKDSYYLGPGGAAINVFDITSDGQKFFAATENGIYTAPLSGVNLTDYNSWSKLSNLPYSNSKYNAISFFNGRIYANQANDGYNSDSLYVFADASWTKLKSLSGVAMASIEISYDKIIFSGSGFVDVYDNQHKLINHIFSYNPGASQPSDAVIDKDNVIWIADKERGLVKNNAEWSFEFIVPNGPASNRVISMAVNKGDVWVATGGRDDTWNNMLYQDGIALYSDSKWTSFTNDNTPALKNDTVYDYISTAIDPLNPALVYIGTWSKGMIRFKNKAFDKFYDESNSSLRPFSPIAGYSLVRVGGICFDNNNNMWMTNSGADRPLSVRTPGDNGSWYSFRLNDISTNDYLGAVIVDDFSQKWMIVPRSNGVLVFNDNNTLSTTSDDNSKLLTNIVGNGNLPSSNVYSIANDLDGEIWVGTDKGIGVFYSPGNVFSDNDFDSQPITIEQDGHVQHLLETETVTAIAVDGANRKWLGTQSAGVFLMSPDGTKQIQHFTSDNSPLFSNSITSIAINHDNGEVFFGTTFGLISYKGDATRGEETFDNKDEIYAYPNPVKQNYEGPVAIKGLVRDADIKITGINGTLVYSTKALGGQAIWNCRNFDGRKVQTGVYLVFCSNEDGSQNHGH